MPGDSDVIAMLLEQLAKVQAEVASLRSTVSSLQEDLSDRIAPSMDNVLDRAGDDEPPTSEIFYGVDRYFVEGMSSDTRGTNLGAWKRYAVVNHLAGTVRLTNDSMPVPFPEGEHWHDLTTHRGPIHIPLFS